MSRGGLLIIGLIVLGLCRAAGAQSEDLVLEVNVGWGGRFRPDRWTPAFVTAQAKQPVPVVLRWYVPRPGREAMIIEQSVVLNPERATHVAYLPIGPDPAAVHLTVAHARTGRTLAHWPTTALSPIVYADAQVRDEIFIGVSGAAPALRALDERRFKVAYLAPELLPHEPIGYEGLDQLALNRPHLASMAIEQQEAIAAWVRAGGRLVMWLELQALPEESPLLGLIPGGGVAEFTYRVIGEEQAGYTRLRDAPEDALVTRAAVGAGEVIFLHMAPEDAARQGAQLIQEEGRAALPEPPPLPPEAIEAVRSASRVSRFGSFVPLLFAALLIGPVDWLVLQRSHRRMRRWLTVPGWLAVFALLIWYVPARPQAQTWASASLAQETLPAIAQSSVAMTAGRLVSAEAPELASLRGVGNPYWRTIGSGRMRGAIREIVFVQGDDGMLAGRTNEPAPAFVAEGVAFRR